jgi:3-hydroxyisobutyrate dehydrogenase-like beta-hydroxyacid dehydrogenase
MSRPIGLIGAGLMGIAIAERLLNSKFELIGWDLKTEQRAELARIGGWAAESLQQVFNDCELIVLSLPNDAVVREVLVDHSSLLRQGQHVIDTSTGDPDAAIEIAQLLHNRGVAYLDATISGSSAQVRDGSAIAIVGAVENALCACQSVLDALAAQVLHVGPPGSGSQMKLVTNLVLGLNRAALAEGLVFAQSLGLSLEFSLAVLKASMAYSRIMDTKGNKMIANDFSPQAKLDQHAKDVKLMLRSATSKNIELPLSQTHLELLQRASQLGYGELDNSAIIEAYRKTNSESKS